MTDGKLGYIFDNRHFRNMKVTSSEFLRMPPCKEVREIEKICIDLKVNGLNPNYFEIVDIKQVKLKFMKYIVYIIRDTRNGKGCGMFINGHEVVPVKLKGYKYTDPYQKDWICKDVNEAIKQTGKIKEEVKS